MKFKFLKLEHFFLSLYVFIANTRFNVTFNFLIQFYVIFFKILCIKFYK